MNKSTLWEEAVGGRIGEEFRKSLKSNSIKEFINKHPLEAQNLAKSYQTYFKKPHPQLSQILNSKKINKKKSEYNKKSPTLERRHKVEPLTVALLAALVLIVGFGVVGFKYVYKQPTKINDTQAKVAGVAQDEDPTPFMLTTLENPTLGYKLSYPEGWTVMSLKNDEVEISPSTGKGKVIVKVVEDVVSVDVDLQDSTNQEAEMINKAAKITKETFEFTEAVEYDKNEIRKRFIDAKREVN